MTDQKPPHKAVVPAPQPTKTARFMAPEQWDDQIWIDNPIFAELAALFPLASCTDFPTVAELDNWRQLFRPEFRSQFSPQLSPKFSPQLPVRFVDNDLLAADGRYYEAFIYHTQQVPTRYPNWHDLFGALIWCLFPQTKKLLNQLHIREIELHGATMRTDLRNKLTLLDECGVMILFRQQQANVVEMLRQHQWQQALVSQRDYWYGQGEVPGIAAMMFGHANYEMATRPFIGLTGKMLAIAVPDDFFSQSLRQRIDFIDTALSEQIANQGILSDPQQLTPLPLLGVPGWYGANVQPEFYQNTGYFRPKRAR